MSLSQDDLVEILKKKGVGASMGKHLSDTECQQVVSHLKNNSLSLITRATLWVAILMLPMTETESEHLSILKREPHNYLPSVFHFTLEQSLCKTDYEELVFKVVNGSDLTEKEMTDAMLGLFQSDRPTFLKAMFLEAERLKRETPIENAAALAVLWGKTKRESVTCKTLIDLSIGYDGFNRTPFLAVFLAPLLAEMGYPTLCHGIYEVAPKKGLNFYKILECAGKNVRKPIKDVARDLETTGWGYADQTQFLPELSRLVSLRTDMVKRPVLATVEKLVQPIKGQKNFLVTGYTHPPYKEKMVHLLNRRKDWKGFLVCRGVEGSIQLPLDRRAPLVSCVDGKVKDQFVKPDQWGLSMKTWEKDQKIDAKTCLDLGCEALSGATGLAHDTLIYMASEMLTHLSLMHADDAFDLAKDVLKSGRALARFDQLT